MSGNCFGKLFRVCSFGESHGKMVGAVVDGCPAGLELSEGDIQKELDKRKPGQGIASTQRKESDKVEIVSGVFQGKTLGTSICLLVRNEDADSKAYENINDLFRPGQADYSYWKKFGFRDFRGGGRASGRETIARVAAGAIAKKILAKQNIEITAFVKEIASIKAEKIDFSEIEKNSLKCPDALAAKKMEKAIANAREKGDSVGGIVEIIAKNVPAGLGEPVFEKLDAEIAKAMMGIGAAKGIEIGAGFGVANKKGSENNDEMKFEKGKVIFSSNNAGGILGGISTGQEIVVRIAIKPTPSIATEQNTINEKNQNKKIKISGRHDACICPRIVPVAEAMLAIVLTNALLEQRGKQNAIQVE